MTNQWKGFWFITVLCLLGTAALGYIAFTSVPPTNSSAFIEVTKTVFLCLGGLGVILPLYLNATNIILGRESEKIERTFDLLSKWDDPHFLKARGYTRKIKKKISSISADELIKELEEGGNEKDPELEQSVILVANYFEHVRFSIEQNRIDVPVFKASLGPVIVDIIDRFRPYFNKQGDALIKDLDKLKKHLE